MARPRKCRWVCCEPSVTYFKPRGVPLIALDKVSLTVDELEAVRLKDLGGLDQEEAAVTMKVSQPTFHRILESAHYKIADGLANGKAIRIEGGDYMIWKGERLFKCCDCQSRWREPLGTARPVNCPKCKGTNIHRAPQDRGHVRASRKVGARLKA
jgi:predicted DNA-binding protein (UPF0251 family)